MKELRSNAALIGNVLLHRYSIFVLNGFLLAASLLFYMQDNYEHGVIKALASNVNRKYSGTRSNDSILIGALKLTHVLEEKRNVIFEKEEMNDVYSDFLRPVTYDLMTAKGSCGSYSMVLGSILDELGYKVRFAQMKVGETWGGHIIIEAKTAKGWAVLDPSFNLFFKRADGSLANFSDVQQNWDFYKQQLPEDYIHDYKYADVRYTNWEKIPVVMPALKGLFKLTIGEQATNDLCLRIYFLRKFRLLSYFTLLAYVFSWYMIVRRYRRKRTAITRKINSPLIGTVASASKTA